MHSSIKLDIKAIQAIKSVPTILQVISESTGMQFTCVARVTEDSWTTCAVLDKAGFGLKVGDGLDVSTTLCKDVLSTRQPIIINDADIDPVYCKHIAPKIYGFRSYISIPLYRANGDYFGSLCGLDSLPMNISSSNSLATMTLFAQLISLQLESEEQLNASITDLIHEKDISELREQFIGILGHDLRTPLQSISLGTDVLLRLGLPPQAITIVERIKRSSLRIGHLVDDVLDLTRAKMGGGIDINVMEVFNLKDLLLHCISEIQAAYLNRTILIDLNVPNMICCDGDRLIQLVSNLITNAIAHGASDKPVKVKSSFKNGYFLISVANEGHAVPLEQLANIFQPYKKATGSSSDGLGLGLYIVSEIAKSHKGKMDVASTDIETKFTFTLPIIA